MPKMGGEEATAARLQGVQPMIITIRSCIAARAIDSTWRAADVNSGAVYDIKAVSNPDEKNAWLEIMAVQGSPDAQGPTN
jgi:head-tail adaptor